MREAIQIGSLKSSQSSSTSSHNSNQEPPSMKAIGAEPRSNTKSSNSKESNHFVVKITSVERHPSVTINRSTKNMGLVPPPRREGRRLSENPRNINLLHDIPRENKRIYKKRKSSRSSRSNSRQLLAKIISK